MSPELSYIAGVLTIPLMSLCAWGITKFLLVDGEIALQCGECRETGPWTSSKHYYRCTVVRHFYKNPHCAKEKHKQGWRRVVLLAQAPMFVALGFDFAAMLGWLRKNLGRKKGK